MPRSRRDAVRSVLLVLAVLAALVAVRWPVTGGLARPLPSAATAPAPPAPDRGPALTVPGHAGTRLSLGGRKPIVVDLASGAVARIPSDPDSPTALFRHGGHTVLVAGERAWAVPAGRTGPLRPLGPALVAMPAPAEDRVWLVTMRFGAPGQQYALVEVGLADGRARTRLTLPYQAAPVAVLPSGVLARDVDDDLVVVQPGSGRARGVLARSATFVAARGARVAWLAGRDLHVRDLTTGAALVVPPPPGSPGWEALGGPGSWAGCCYALGAFSPDGRRLAVYARSAGPGAPGLAVVDLVRGGAALVSGSAGATPAGCLPCLAWASNGWLYFFTAGPALTSIGAWAAGAGPDGLLSLDVDWATEGVPNALAAS